MTVSATDSTSRNSTRDRGSFRKPRIAWVSPAPPVETGIADYALEVADVLKDRFEIEWVIDSRSPTPTAALAGRYRYLTADEFEHRHSREPYDLPVYHIGNNHFHIYALDLMHRHPGLLVVHDAHLGGLFRSAADAGVWPTTFEEELEYNGEPLLADWVDRGLVHPHTVPTLSPLNRRVFEMAAGVLVHSAWAWQLVRRVTDVPVSIVPHLAHVPVKPLDRLAERRRLRLPADEFVVCSLGIVSIPKRHDVLIRAVGGLPEPVRSRTRLVCVGPCHPETREKMMSLAKATGIADRVEFRGKAPLEDFAAYAAAADACVQLRFPSNGETSGAVARVLAAGGACIVSDVGSMAELPNSVVWKVRSPVRDCEDLVDALTHLEREPQLRERLSASAREFVARTCTCNVVVARYAAAISNAMSPSTVARLSCSDVGRSAA